MIVSHMNLAAFGFRSPKRVSDKPSWPRLRFLRWGIFDIAYESPGSKPCSELPADAWDVAYGSAPFLARLVAELYTLAPATFILYTLTGFAISCYPAINLHLTSTALFLATTSISTGQLDAYASRFLQYLVFVWIISAVFDTLADRVLGETSHELCGHLRANLIPKLAKSKMRIREPEDPNCQEDPATGYYIDFSYETNDAGWRIIEAFFRKINSFLSVCLQILVLISVIKKHGSPELKTLAFLSILHPIVIYATPSGGIGAAEYIFWTECVTYQRILSLYKTIFTPTYRQDLLKDGVSTQLAAEYERTSKVIGDHKPDAYVLWTHFPRPWLCEVLHQIMADLPMVACVLTLLWTSSPRSLVTIALLYHTTNSLRPAVSMVYACQSLESICSEARRLYDIIDRVEVSPRRTLNYPLPEKSSEKGMAITFRNVSLQYESQKFSGHKALTGVSFDIRPGQLVVIVGVNGSGKSSMLKLVPRLINPTSGDILVDGKPISDFNLTTLRRSMAILSQSQSMYPLSLRDNIQLGLPGGLELSLEKMKEAAKLGGAYDLIQKLGHDTILDPLPCMGSDRYHESEALRALAEEHYKKPISISGGEEQRLFASRTFMRLKNSDVRLLVVDEPMSALDPLAERDLIERFLSLREGKTMIFVTHRFARLVTKADLILCMNAGQIIESGTHQELMRLKGEYARLYNVQAGGFE